MSAEQLWGVVPAAGSGTRMGTAVPKQYLPLGGATVIEHSVRRLLVHPAMAAVAVAVQSGDPHWPSLSLSGDARVLRAPGGATRMESVLGGLSVLPAEDDDWVLVHDAARPCLRVADLRRLVGFVMDHPVGGLLALPVADTVKRADAAEDVLETVDRSHLWRALTPQMFRYGLLREALERALADGVTVTDESQALERLGHRPHLVAGSPDNLKITHPGDLDLAELFLQRIAAEEAE